MKRGGLQGSSSSHSLNSHSSKSSEPFKTDQDSEEEKISSTESESFGSDSDEACDTDKSGK